jgi:ribosomal protein S18 acetylase RimI-like enzyme
LNLKVYSIHWDDINKSEIVKFIFSVRKQDEPDLSVTINKLYDFFEKFAMIGASTFIIASIDNEIVGSLFLYQSNASTFIINMDSILGGNPFVKDLKNSQTIVKNLLIEVKSYAMSQKFENIEFLIGWNPKADQDYYKNLINSYAECGFQVKLKYVEMSCELQKFNIPNLKDQSGINISQTTHYNLDALYKCYYDAFINGDAKFFKYQTKKERREYFENLIIPRYLNEEASITLSIDKQIIGFSFVLKFDEDSDHISCMCLKPTYQGKKLGKYMLFKIMEILKHQDSKKITLGTEIDMRAYYLYKKYCFDVDHGFIEFRWSKYD